MSYAYLPDKKTIVEDILAVVIVHPVLFLIVSNSEVSAAVLWNCYLNLHWIALWLRLSWQYDEHWLLPNANTGQPFMCFNSNILVGSEPSFNLKLGN